PIILSWTNKQNIKFFIEISVDENYMFAIKQKVENLSNRDITVAPYGRINRFLNIREKANYILHEGFLGVFGGILQEISYDDAAEDGDKNFAGAGGSWFGITDKYWLTAIIADENLEYKTNFSYKKDLRNNIFAADFLGQEFKIEKKSTISFNHHFFAGAKKVKLLDQYSKDFNIKLFDRAIDFGWFYFITKPFFFAIDFLNKFLGNFGLAILTMTVLVKIALFPTANKSYAAMARMKKLQPKMNEIREKFKEDKLAMNREIMAMYKREKINPASGCLPILIQIPIFFSLYKVIFVTLDMRHAPFYGWIKDLSAPDPTSIFNLFGLLPFEVGGILAIGIWPILMGLSMYFQQKLSPPIADPTQAKVLKFMPYILTFVLASFPAGLVIYWTWNNILSIAQQYYITNVVYKS
ncbi:MAG TPA: membrane protein insertase YidC, partial [Rickettsiales bacterium]|nr:membrane protein insertase YidC [Rickettsiales bacterium]